MIGKNNINLSEDLLKPLIDNGFEGMLQVITTLLNEAMKIERNRHLQVESYQRSEQRDGYANGFKNKVVKTRMGEMILKVPQVRESSKQFYPKSIEKGCRSERALKLAIAEMYIQGVSTRKVEAITKELCGIDISSSEVSRACKELDEELQKFRNRNLGEYPYVFFDAQYHKVRHSGTIISIGVLTAIGINRQGQREVIGVTSSFSEAQENWKVFFESLVKRGLHNVELMISDDHAGLKAAKREVFPSIPWQRCQFHLAQNAQAYAPKKSMKKELAIVMRDIFRCSTKESALEQIRQAELKYEKSAPEFVKWLLDNVEEGLNCLNYPVEHQKKIRTVNGLERLHREIKRRTRVASIFPNIESCLRLITAILIENHENWISSLSLMNMNHLYSPDEVDAFAILRQVV